MDILHIKIQTLSLIHISEPTDRSRGLGDVYKRQMIALFFNIVSTVMSIFTRNEDSFFVAMFGVFSSVVMLGIVRCSFAGGSYKPRSYELFVKDDMGEKK